MDKKIAYRIVLLVTLAVLNNFLIKVSISLRHGVWQPSSPHGTFHLKLKILEEMNKNKIR